MIKLLGSIITFIILVLFTISFAGGKTAYYVDPGGDDSNDGLSANRPFQTIQKAVDLAQPGDSIKLSAGIYLQDILSKKDGLPGTPIVITGPREAVVGGGGGLRIIEVRHSYISLKGFTVDGKSGTGTSASDFRDKLIYVLGREPKKGAQGVKITGMRIQNAGGECIRLRYFAQNNEISDNTIQNCGLYDFRFNNGGKNGEGIYIGTAPEQRNDGRNPTDDPDQSNNNLIRNNIINTNGNECVDIKEGSSGNIIENNSCTGQQDPLSGGLDSRGNGNIFRSNNIFDNKGAGIRLGGDHKGDGTDNDVYGNIIRSNASGGIKFEKIPQRKICGNIMSENNGGETVGSYGEKFKPSEICPV